MATTVNFLNYCKNLFLCLTGKRKGEKLIHSLHSRVMFLKYKSYHACTLHKPHCPWYKDQKTHPSLQDLPSLMYLSRLIFCPLHYEHCQLNSLQFKEFTRLLLTPWLLNMIALLGISFLYSSAS